MNACSKGYHNSQMMGCDLAITCDDDNMNNISDYSTPDKLFLVLSKSSMYNGIENKELAQNDLNTIYKNMEIGNQLMANSADLKKSSNQLVETVVYKGELSDSDSSDISSDEFSFTFNINDDYSEKSENPVKFVCESCGSQNVKLSIDGENINSQTFNDCLRFTSSSEIENDEENLTEFDHNEDSLKNLAPKNDRGQPHNLLEANKHSVSNENVVDKGVEEIVVSKVSLHEGAISNFETTNNCKKKPVSLAKFCCESVDRVRNSEGVTFTKGNSKEINKFVQSVILENLRRQVKCRVEDTKFSVPQLNSFERLYNDRNILWSDDLDIMYLLRIIDVPKIIRGTYKFLYDSIDNNVFSEFIYTDKNTDKCLTYDKEIIIKACSLGEDLTSHGDSPQSSKIVEIDDGSEPRRLLTDGDTSSNDCLNEIKVKQYVVKPFKKLRYNDTTTEILQIEDNTSEATSETPPCELKNTYEKYVGDDESIASSTTNSLKDVLGKITITQPVSENEFLHGEDLKVTMRGLNIQSSVLEENEDETSVRESEKSWNKITPVKYDSSSKISYNSVLMDEEKTRRLLEIREKRLKLKKRREDRVIARQKCMKGPLAPGPTNSITRLSITNRSFYNSIFGHILTHAKTSKTKFYNNKLYKKAIKDKGRNLSMTKGDTDRFHKDKKKQTYKNMDFVVNTFKRNSSPGWSDSSSLNRFDDLEEPTAIENVPVKNLDHMPVNKLNKAKGKVSINLMHLDHSESRKDTINRNIKTKISHALKTDCKNNIDKIYNMIGRRSSEASDGSSFGKRSSLSYLPLENWRKGKDKAILSPNRKTFPKIVLKRNNVPKNTYTVYSNPIENFEDTSPAISKLLNEVDGLQTRHNKQLKKLNKSKSHSPKIEDDVFSKNSRDIKPKMNTLDRNVVRRFHKRISDIIDEAKEARGEAVRGPGRGYTLERLETLAQPKRSYVQARAEEMNLKQKSQQRSEGKAKRNINQQANKSRNNEKKVKLHSEKRVQASSPNAEVGYLLHESHRKLGGDGQKKYRKITQKEVELSKQNLNETEKKLKNRFCKENKERIATPALCSFTDNGGSRSNPSLHSGNSINMDIVEKILEQISTGYGEDLSYMNLDVPDRPKIDETVSLVELAEVNFDGIISKEHCIDGLDTADNDGKIGKNTRDNYYKIDDQIILQNSMESSKSDLLSLVLQGGDASTMLTFNNFSTKDQRNAKDVKNFKFSIPMQISTIAYSFPVLNNNGAVDDSSDNRVEEIHDFDKKASTCNEEPSNIPKEQPKTNKEKGNKGSIDVVTTLLDEIKCLSKLQQDIAGLAYIKSQDKCKITESIKSVVDNSMQTKSFTEIDRSNIRSAEFGHEPMSDEEYSVKSDNINSSISEFMNEVNIDEASSMEPVLSNTLPSHSSIGVPHSNIAESMISINIKNEPNEKNKQTSTKQFGHGVMIKTEVPVENDASYTSQLNINHTKSVSVDFPQVQFISTGNDAQHPLNIINFPSKFTSVSDLYSIFQNAVIYASKNASNTFVETHEKTDIPLEKAIAQHSFNKEGWNIIDLFRRTKKSKKIKITITTEYKEEERNEIHKKRIKRDILLSLYTILMLAVFAAMTYPQVLVFQNQL